MGLDGVELVIAVEEEFGIAIDDRDAERILTVGALWDYICERVSFVPTQVCASAASLYRLRRAFMAMAIATRSSFRPETPLEQMLPTKDRRAAWKRLEETASIKLPALELPPALVHVQVWLSICLPMSIGLILVANDYVLTGMLALIGGFLLMLTLLQRLILPWQTRLNPAWATAGGLAQTVVGLNPTVWNVPATQSREIAWERLRVLVAETLGVSLDLVRPEASFVNDLGMD